MSDIRYSYNKNKMTQIGLAKLFIVWKEETKIPTFERLQTLFEVGRGTIQSSLKKLQDEGAIILETKGSSGTFLIKKNIKVLIRAADMKFILGALPLPNYPILTGLATALLSTLSKYSEVQVNMTYTRSAINRINLLKTGRYDSAIVSKTTAQDFINRSDSLEIIADFGYHTFYSGFYLVFSDKNNTELKPGIIVAIITD